MKWVKLLMCLTLAFGCVQMVGCGDGASEITEYDEIEHDAGHEDEVKSLQEQEDPGGGEDDPATDPAADQGFNG